MEPRNPYSGYGQPDGGRDTTQRTADPNGDQNDTATDITYESGARRSVKMPYYAAIPGRSIRRVALRATGAPRGETLTDKTTNREYEGGSDKYGYRNWQRGLPFEDTFNHLIDHLYAWKASIESGIVPREDELAGVGWAVLLPLMEFEREYARQFEERNRVLFGEDVAEGWASGSPVISAEEADAHMRRWCDEQAIPYLLQSLSPVAPRPTGDDRRATSGERQSASYASTATAVRNMELRNTLVALVAAIDANTDPSTNSVDRMFLLDVLNRARSAIK